MHRFTIKAEFGHQGRYDTHGIGESPEIGHSNSGLGKHEQGVLRKLGAKKDAYPEDGQGHGHYTAWYVLYNDSLV